MSRLSSRRRFMVGAAATVGLPFLPSMMGRALADCGTPQRFLSWFLPCGVVMPDWTPTTTGTGWTMPYILAPLAPVRSKIVVLTGHDHMVSTTSNPGGHSAGTGGFLTMRKIANDYNDPNRTSLDQVIAKQTAACNRPIASLQLSLDVPQDTCDNAPCQFVHTVSYSANNPLPHEVSPLNAFNLLFGGTNATATATDAVRRQALRKSVLDHVLAETQSLSPILSPSDRAKLDEYTTAVRSLEVQIQNMASAGQCSAAVSPATTDTATYQDRVAAMVELIALAFQCDMTRVVSFMMARGSSLQDWQFLVNAPSPHHRISHHNNDPKLIALLRQINNWEINQLSLLLQKLDAIQDVNGKTILDNTLVYCSSEIADGNSHNKWDVPVLLAGSAGGALKIDGRHVSYTKMTFPRPLVGPQGGPHTEHTFVSILNAFGVNVNTFGDATVTGANTDILPG
jgi:Protein of unknown function (DUF1552)